MLGIFSALGAAFAWTTASAIWRSIPTSLNSLKLNGLKNLIASIIFLPFLFTVPWLEEWRAIILLLLSGCIGIAIGDSFYLAALRRLGTRRTLTIEAISPLMAGIGSTALMNESQSLQSWFGALLVSTSVVMVARQSPPKKNDMTMNSTRSQHVGIMCSLAALVCGLSGAFLSRLVLMNEKLLPIQTSAIRLIGGLALLTPLLLPKTKLFGRPRPAQKRWPRVLIATLVGTNAGILLTQVVFSHLPVGQGVTLLSTAPVMALLFSKREGDEPKFLGFLSSVISVIGVGLVVSS